MLNAEFTFGQSETTLPDLCAIGITWLFTRPQIIFFANPAGKHG